MTTSGSSSNASQNPDRDGVDEETIRELFARRTPTGPQGGKPVWYRRRALLVGAAVAVIAAITVLTDLPEHTSLADQVSEESTVINAIDGDSAPCIYAAKEAFGFYADMRSGSLTSSERSRIPGLLSNDEGACSFTSEYVYDLSGIEVPGTAAGRDVGNALNSVTLWITSDALAAIQAIIGLTNSPADANDLASLAKSDRYLSSDRKAADADIADAERALGGAKLPGLGLPSFPLAASGT